MSELKGKTALVTGASSGLGVDFARELAARGADLVLAARREAPMQTLAEELRSHHGVQVRIETVDLADAGARERLAQSLQEQGVAVDILVNNAGFGLYGDFGRMEWPAMNQMLQLDVVALTHLTHLFVGPMRQRGYGRILQVASTASYQPSPTYTAYGAAKAYVLSFGVALNHELAGSGVSCTVVSPGVTATEFLQVSGQRRNWFHNSTMMTSARVAALGVRATLQGRASIVTGWINAISAFSMRLLPIRWAAAMGAFVMKN